MSNASPLESFLFLFSSFGKCSLWPGKNRRVGNKYLAKQRQGCGKDAAVRGIKKRPVKKKKVGQPTLCWSKKAKKRSAEYYTDERKREMCFTCVR